MSLGGRTSQMPQLPDPPQPSSLTPLPFQFSAAFPGCVLGPGGGQGCAIMERQRPRVAKRCRAGENNMLAGSWREDLHPTTYPPTLQGGAPHSTYKGYTSDVDSQGPEWSFQLSCCSSQPLLPLSPTCCSKTAIPP